MQMLKKYISVFLQTIIKFKEFPFLRLMIFFLNNLENLHCHKTSLVLYLATKILDYILSYHQKYTFPIEMS